VIAEDGSLVADSQNTFIVAGTVGAYSETLLAGSVLDYGIVDWETTDRVDFQLGTIGGSMMGVIGSEVGAVVDLEGSTFVGTFTENWHATRTKGDLGAVPTPPLPSAEGTGTLGYWKNHPDAWPVSSLTVGSTIFNQDDLISILKTPTRGDKTISMAKQLIPAKLNVADGNDSSCIDDTIAAADAWLIANGGVGSGLRQWVDDGDLLHDQLDAYNNGLLCAPSRD
jgi:hypothetical protein